MNGPDHYEMGAALAVRAERLAADFPAEALAVATTATAHATLALAAAVGISAGYPGGLLPITDFYRWSEVASVLRAPDLDVRGPRGHVRLADPFPVLVAALRAYADEHPLAAEFTDVERRDRIAEHLAAALLADRTDGAPYVPPQPDGPSQP
ncbi:hypothetical protein ACFYS8_13285 [Kitasatospora sp. NPDC004615]|uniref:hypothetical protein n=1 Tax=unclassified Kitasatospora TaxID=2633591 RepID=UPI0036BDF94B